MSCLFKKRPDEILVTVLYVNDSFSPWAKRKDDFQFDKYIFQLGGSSTTQ